VLAGTGVAAYEDSAVWWKALLALLVSLALQVAVNYANDYSDGIRGTDADRVGPLRLVGSGVATPGAVKAAAFAAFVRELARRDRRPILVAFGNPYLLQQTPEAAAYVVAWSGIAASQQAAARALLGTIPVTGRLPIAIPPLAPLGAGEERAAGVATPRAAP
jgi:hypothetical protein